MEDEKEKGIEDRNKQILDLTKKVNELKREKAKNLLETQLEALNKDLLSQQHELQLEVDSYKNKMRMLEHSKKVQLDKCRQLIAEKKSINDEIEYLYTTLNNEREQSNAANIIAEKMKDLEEQKVLIFKNDTNDLNEESKYQNDIMFEKRNKSATLQETINMLNFNIEEKTIQNNKLKKANDKAMNRLIKMDAEHSENGAKRREIEVRNEDMSNKIEKSKEEGNVLLLENQRHRDKVNYLMRKIQINEELKNIDLDELKTLAKTNIQMNSMMNQLVDKWDFVKQLNEQETEVRRDF